jgi:hypothetical protein
LKDLTPTEAEKLGEVWALVYRAYNLMEDLRPGGGFKERIDPKYCKCCGKVKDD